MDFNLLIVNKNEYNNMDSEQMRLFSECDKASISISHISKWQFLQNALNPEHAGKILVLTCSDEGIRAALEHELVVIAWRNPEYDRMYGYQELFGALVLLESFFDVDVLFLNQVYDRAVGIPLTIGDTKRCSVREIAKTDIARLYELLDGNINQDSLHPMKLSKEEFEAFWCAYIRDMYGFYGYGLWLVLRGDEIIGLAGLENANYEFLSDSEIELGYWIAPQYRRQGYALEVCEYLLLYAKEALQLERIWIYTLEENHPSRTLAERLGFWRMPKEEENARKYGFSGVLHYMKPLQF
jgi:RimJ/RimL family protein N-acetyltransferase